ncbi:MAG: hypothetical protein Q8880_09730 [Bacteroidota bacterium]|nr:hypothetical protein [Bacteroidota bacterium]
MKKNNYWLFVLFFPLFIISCVPARQFDDLKARSNKCEDDLAKYKSENQDLTNKNMEMTSLIETQNKKIKNLVIDTAELGNTLKRITVNYHELDKTYESLLQNNAKLLNDNSDETKKIVEKFQNSQLNLQKKEDELKALEHNLETKKQEYEELTQKLSVAQTENQKKEAKLNELQRILSAKDSVVKALKNKVADALLGFENKGLTVTQKNGKVYVSLEESLLFQTGSITVDKKGVEALKKLAKALEKNEDVKIFIDGHTYNVTYKGVA